MFTYVYNPGIHVCFLQGIPTLVNRHDRNYEIIIRDVKAKVKQVSRLLHKKIHCKKTCCSVKNLEFCFKTLVNKQDHQELGMHRPNHRYIFLKL